MEERTCSTCGAVYELTEHKVPMRDRDSERCEFCGTKIISCNGGCIWTKKLVSPATNPKYVKR